MSFYLLLLFIGTCRPENNVFSEPELYDGVNNVLNGSTMRHFTRALAISRFRASRQTTPGIWENGKVPYAFSSEFNHRPVEKQLVQLAMLEIQRSAPCVHFIDRGDNYNFINFVYTDVNNCETAVGLTRNGEHLVNLNGACMDRNNLLHELMHVLGFHHEHSRPDSWKYVKIHWNNILTNKWKNFEMEPAASERYAYDFASVMHYSKYAYSINIDGITIEPLNPALEIKANGLSHLDVKKIRTLYNCLEELEPDIPPRNTSQMTKRINGRIDDLNGTFDKSMFYFDLSTRNFIKAPLLFREYLTRKYGGAWIVVYHRPTELFESSGSFSEGNSHAYHSAERIETCFFAEVVFSHVNKSLNCTYWKRVMERNNIDSATLKEIVDETYKDMRPFDDSPRGSVICGKNLNQRISTTLANYCDITLNVTALNEIVQCRIFLHYL